MKERGSYSILKRIEKKKIVKDEERIEFKRMGVVVDKEKKGINKEKEEIIEIGEVELRYEDEG